MICEISGIDPQDYDDLKNVQMWPSLGETRPTWFVVSVPSCGRGVGRRKDLLDHVSGHCLAQLVPGVRRHQEERERLLGIVENLGVLVGREFHIPLDGSRGFLKSDPNLSFQIILFTLPCTKCVVCVYAILGALFYAWRGPNPPSRMSSGVISEISPLKLLVEICCPDFMLPHASPGRASLCPVLLLCT